MADSDLDDDIVLHYAEPGGRRSVVLEDDGKVAYAYLREGSKIIGDVWLYNVGGDPEHINWRDRSALPFCNPAKYCSAEVLPRLSSDSRISCQWSVDGVTISVDGLVWAQLANGSKPGWSRKARVAGPLAKPLPPDVSNEKKPRRGYS